MAYVGNTVRKYSRRSDGEIVRSPVSTRRSATAASILLTATIGMAVASRQLLLAVLVAAPAGAQSRKVLREAPQLVAEAHVGERLRGRGAAQDRFEDVLRTHDR